MNPPITCVLSITRTGRATLTSVNDGDYPHVREHFVHVARACGDGIVVEAECVSGEEKDAMAQRVAELLLQEAGLL